MSTATTSRPRLKKETALAMFPCRVPPVRRRRNEKDRLLVTVEFLRPRWQQWLGSGPKAERTFSLDLLGQEVYRACDGKTRAQAIIRHFARQHKISLAEAEMAVSLFLKTLLSKGLIVMSPEQQADE